MLLLRRILLFPFACLYAIPVGVRNFLYHHKIFKSVAFDLPVISVGNLSTGGTGKTPHIEYLLRWLQSHHCQAGTLSRGYRRRTHGFHIATMQDSAAVIGDEPWQIKQNFPEALVAVGEDRAIAIPQMVEARESLRAILMDDAFQHRSVTPALQMLLTEYDKLYCNDMLLPAGNLREPAGGARRADVVVVSKCPEDLTVEKMQQIRNRLQPGPHQLLAFSTLAYGNPYPILEPGRAATIRPDQPIVLITALADPHKLESYLRSKCNLRRSFHYPDHHYFTKAEVENWLQYSASLSGEVCWVTTQKDAARLLLHPEWWSSMASRVLVMPVTVRFLAGTGQLLEDRLMQLLNRPE